MSTRDTWRDFGSFATTCRDDDLPEDAADTGKKSILDLLGISMAASGTAPVYCTLECSVLGLDGQVAVLSPAFANGGTAQCGSGHKPHLGSRPAHAKWGQHK